MILRQCETPTCRRTLPWFMVRVRHYHTKTTGPIKGRARTCGRCHRKIKSMIQ